MMISPDKDAAEGIHNAPHYVLGTAGHIDHGKSTLVQALTGTDPDRLEEEKRRGITIELGFACLELPDGSTMGVVDVPGHERFVRQMIAGATGIDLALLCIAADDGVMPQTVEHLAVLELLGVSRLVVALTKTDLVDDEWVKFVTDEVNTLLESSMYEGAAVVAVSARTGVGLDDLRTALVNAARGLRREKSGVAARMPVDRVFSIKGSGTVVTGTLWSGRVAPGDQLDILPKGTAARVRAVQEHSSSVEMAEAGNRVAINLGSVGLDEVRPGMFLATPGTIFPTDRFDAWMTFIGYGAKGQIKLLETGTRVRVAHGTAEVTGRLLFMDGQVSVSPHEATFVQIRLDEPLPLSRKDRFVVRSMTPICVIAGGSVLHAHPRRRTNLREGEKALLDALRMDNDVAACYAAFALQAAPAFADDIAAVAGLEPDTVCHYLDEKCAAGDAVSIGRSDCTCYVSHTILQKHLSALDNTLLKFHIENPDALGMTKAALRDRLPHHLSEQVFDALLTYAREEGYVTIGEGGFIGHPKGVVNVQAREDQVIEKLADALTRAASSPPSPEELFKQTGIDTTLGRRVLSTLEKQGRARRIATDLVFDEKAFIELERIVVEWLTGHGASTTSELKDAMGISRKYAIPILEYFDEQGITKRDEATRVLGPKVHVSPPVT